MSTPSEIMALRGVRDELAESEVGPKSFGLPDRWFDEGPRFRCTGGHVTAWVIKSEALLRDACPSCGGHTLLTFPEDTSDSDR